MYSFQTDIYLYLQKNTVTYKSVIKCAKYIRSFEKLLNPEEVGYERRFREHNEAKTFLKGRCRASNDPRVNRLEFLKCLDYTYHVFNGLE